MLKRWKSHWGYQRILFSNGVFKITAEGPESFTVKGRMNEKDAEIARLRLENRRLLAEREILKNVSKKKAILLKLVMGNLLHLPI